MRPDKNGKTILLGEDEPEVRSYLEVALRCQGYTVELAQDGDEVLSYFQGGNPGISAVLLDIIMPGKDGIETLRAIRNLDKDLPVIMVSGASSPLNVVEAMKNGATDFLGKPVNHEDLRRIIKKALDSRCDGSRDASENETAPMASQTFFGNTPRMREIQVLIPQIGWSEAPVLIQGETGVGKEVLARQLHGHSPRAGRPLLKLNCAALPSELVESELFGYERGAFTGAFQKKPGMFELADGGTILLDEIGDMDFKLQAKLLQVLQDHEFQRLGGKETIRVDVRVMAATHNDLEKAIAASKFREDLFYRLNVINLHLPPLRERREDIMALAEFLLRKHLPEGVPAPIFTPVLKQALLTHEWPGNIRELENVIRKFTILGDPEMIARELRSKVSRKAVAPAAESTGDSVRKEPAAIAPPILEQVTKAKQQAETEAILAALNATRWNRKQAAALLKIDYKALLYKMKKLAIEDKVVSFPGDSTSGPPIASGANGR